MTNLNKIVLIAIYCFAISSAHGGQAIIFDDPGLTAFRQDDKISGIYDMSNPKFSCYFLFFQNGPTGNAAKNEGFSEAEILTFVPGDDSPIFTRRRKDFDVPGNLYRRGDEWSIKTSEGQAGCENATGVFMFAPGADPGAHIYRVQKEINAIGIRLVKEKSYFYDYSGAEFSRRKGYLTKWNGVVVLKTRGQFSYVRFVDARLDAASLGRVTTGWIRTADLVDPFPATANH